MAVENELAVLEDKWSSEADQMLAMSDGTATHTLRESATMRQQAAEIACALKLLPLRIAGVGLLAMLDMLGEQDEVAGLKLDVAQVFVAIEK